MSYSSSRTVAANLRRVSRASSVSLRMVIEHLPKCTMVNNPKNLSQRFLWVEPVIDINDYEIEHDPEHVLYLTRDEDTSLLLEKLHHQSCCGIISFLVPEEKDRKAKLEKTAPPPVGEPDQITVVRSQSSFLTCVKAVQDLFLSLNLWEAELDRIAYLDGRNHQRGVLSKLISSASILMDGFLCATGSGFNMIACSNAPHPPSPTFEYLIENGCYSKSDIERIKKEVLAKTSPKRKVATCTPHSGNPFFELHCPLYIDGAYLFHFTYVPTDDKSLETSTDLFNRFLVRASLICNDFWKNQPELESTYHKMLIKMIEGADMTPAYLDVQMKMTPIAEAKAFRLIGYHLDRDMPHALQAAAAESAKRLNGGLCCPFVHHDWLLALCYESSSEPSRVSLRRVIASTERIMHEPYRLTAVISQHFADIHDIAQAFRQVQAAEPYGSILGRISAETDEESRPHAVPFEHALPFILLDRGIDDDLVAYALGNGILKILVEEDARAGSDFVALLWEYLCSNLNAASTAKKMNVCRNTVVYHINKFEKRFDLSLGSPATRQRLILDYQYHFFKHAKRTPPSPQASLPTKG